MNNPEVVAINTHFYGGSGPWAVAVSNYPIGAGYRQLYAPVFREKFPAEVFAEVVCLPCGQVEDAEGELRLAREVEKFINEWDDAHGDDAVYPTPDGRYPSAAPMAQWFQEEKDAVCP